jgi:hypothetical protein
VAEPARPGQHVTAIGGSDNHNPDIPADKPGAIGTPTTVIHMASLSTQGFMDGLRAGRAFVDVEGTHDRMLDIHATSGKRSRWAARSTPRKAAGDHARMQGVPGAGSITCSMAARC